MAANTAEPAEGNTLTSYRIERFEEMGFTTKEAQKLAAAKDHIGFDVWPGLVEKVLKQGASHIQAVKIFT